jgi:hypothetical protein
MGKYKWEPDIYLGFSLALHLQCVCLLIPMDSFFSFNPVRCYLRHLNIGVGLHGKASTLFVL